MSTPLLLIGGSNIDYIGISQNKLISNVSNIGTISISFGGVMRNICENLARLNNNITFITAIGKDTLGQELKKQLIDLKVKIYSPDTHLPSGSYLAINDNNHDLYSAICDNRIITQINTDFLIKHKNLFSQFEDICLDSNLDEETISYIINTYPNKKYYVDAISPTKVKKYKNFLNKLYLIKCNIHEAKELVGKDLLPYDLTKELLNLGIKNVVVSNSSHNIYYGNNLGIDVLEVKPVKDFENTTGCGDALTSGLINHLIRNHSLKEAVEFAHQLSIVTLMSKSATTKEVEKFKNIE